MPENHHPERPNALRRFFMKNKHNYNETQTENRARQAQQKEYNRMEAERYQKRPSLKAHIVSEYSGDEGGASQLLSKIQASENKKKHTFIDPYKQAKLTRQDFQTQREYNANMKIIKYEESLQRYHKKKGRFIPNAGRVSNTVGRAFSFIKNPSRVLYQQQGAERPRLARDPYRKTRRGRYGYNAIPRQTAAGIQSGRIGRPIGTVKYVNPMTGQPIGVYEYRKILSAQLRSQILQARGQAQLSPMQRQTLQQLDAQQRYQQQNIESRPIPDTNGQVNLRSIHEEADSYAHLFD